MSVEREKSYMLAIPKDPQDLIDVEGIFERLAFAEDFIIKKHSMTEGTINIVLDYKGREYSADFYPYDFKLPEFYRTAHIFNDVDIEAIEKADAGIAVDMFFDENYMDSYHLQLKLIDTILPEKIAVFDDSAEKIMAGDWVKMAAQSMVAPAPKYLFTTQAVSDESGEIWLHTHGLNRCAVTELEILDSTRDTYKTHYNIIETMAKRLLDAEEAFDEKDPVFIARLSNGNDFVATFVNY